MLVITKRFWRTLSLMSVLLACSTLSALVGPLRQPPPPAAVEAELPALPAAPEPAGHLQAPPKRDLLDEVLEPFVEAAHKVRAERALRDPSYKSRMDADVNRNRINFLFLGYGETYEPPFPVDIIGTISILSLDLRSHQLTQISLTHDARAPEIERHLQARGKPFHPSKIDTTYRHGGFELMRLAVENATGLAIDFQVAMEDVFLYSLVDEVLGVVEIDNPIEIETNPIYLKGVQYPCHKFPKGAQRMDSVRTLCYLKGLSLPPYDPRKENNLRKQVVLSGMKSAVQRDVVNPVFAVKMISFLQRQLESKTVAYDFDATSLVLGSIRQLAANAAFRSVSLPSLDQNIYLVDETIGDGGFSWVNVTQNPVIKEEISRGYYKDLNMVVTNGNPYAEDLAKGYWGSTRFVVRTRLLGINRFILNLPERPAPTIPRVRRVPQPY